MSLILLPGSLYVAEQLAYYARGFFFFFRFFCRIGKLLINLHYQLGPPGVNLTLVWKQQMVIYEKCMMSFMYHYVSRQIISF